MNKLADLDVGKIEGFGKLGLEGVGGFAAEGTFNLFLTSTIGLITVVAFIWFTIQTLLGAVAIIGSGGDKAKLEKARAQITSGIIGVSVVISAVFIVELIGTIFGIPFLKGASFISNIVNP